MIGVTCFFFCLSHYVAVSSQHYLGLFSGTVSDEFSFSTFLQMEKAKNVPVNLKKKKEKYYCTTRCLQVVQVSSY